MIKTNASGQNVNQYRLCPKCGNFSHISEGHSFCSVCGEKLLERCPNCNVAIDNPIAQFCVYCGYKLQRKLKN